MRVAWFSPLPPSRSGIAAYSAELLPLLDERLGTIDRYVDPTGIGAPFQIDAAPRTPAPAPRTSHPRTAHAAPRTPHVWSAHDFVWRQRRDPYDLVVYQMGNAECHNYMWAYLFRYPGLVVLHDAQLHQARALWLLKRLHPRREDYLAELRASHPDAPADLGELVAAGLGGTLYHQWPMLALVVRAARLTAVHNEHLARTLREMHPNAAITAIPMGVPGVGSRESGVASAGSRESGVGSAAGVRGRHGIPPDAIVLAAYGGITPEKRIPQLLRAVASLGPRTPELHVLLVGERADHYDVDADVRALGLGDRVHIAGYVPDADLPAYLHAADVASCLRWPTNRETSASWLRCLAAGLPTLITKLSHLTDVPADVALAVDVLDEDSALAPALAALADDPARRRHMGRHACEWWQSHHRLTAMADAYHRLVAGAHARPAPSPDLPPHLRDDGSAMAAALLARWGIARESAGL